MHRQAAARHRTPYGLAFPVQELEYVRFWAARQGLHMHVRLDQVLDGAEFEELLMISAPSRARQALTLWRTDHSVIGQEAGGHPKGFSGVQLALAHFAGTFPAVPPKRHALARWRKLLARL
jgi:hypothetical protein